MFVCKRKFVVASLRMHLKISKTAPISNNFRDHIDGPSVLFETPVLKGM